MVYEDVGEEAWVEVRGFWLMDRACSFGRERPLGRPAAEPALDHIVESVTRSGRELIEATCDLDGWGGEGGHG